MVLWFVSSLLTQAGVLPRNSFPVLLTALAILSIVAFFLRRGHLLGDGASDEAAWETTRRRRARPPAVVNGPDGAVLRARASGGGQWQHGEMTIPLAINPAAPDRVQRCDELIATALDWAKQDGWAPSVPIDLASLRTDQRFAISQAPGGTRVYDAVTLPVMRPAESTGDQRSSSEIGTWPFPEDERVFRSDALVGWFASTRSITVCRDGRVIFQSSKGEHVVPASRITSIETDDDEGSKSVRFRYSGGSIESSYIPDFEVLVEALRSLAPAIRVSGDW
jgi:hypothetical protein